MTNYIFFTGAPGSKWSRASQVFRDSLDDLDNSDKSPKKSYKHPNHGFSGHVGNYYGPGMGLGEWLDNTLGTPSEWEKEVSLCLRDDAKPTKLLLSHHFAYYLEEITEQFPNSTIVLCYRPDVLCFEWWTNCGGWDIAHPSYQWYKNDTKMFLEIRKQNRHILQFAKKYGITLEQPGKDWFREQLGVDKDFKFPVETDVLMGAWSQRRDSNSD